MLEQVAQRAAGGVLGDPMANGWDGRRRSSTEIAVRAPPSQPAPAAETDRTVPQLGR